MCGKLYDFGKCSDSQKKKDTWFQFLRSSHSSQAAIDGAASTEERVESLQELCETLTPTRSSCLATDQLRESDEAQETQPSDTVLPYDW